MEVAQRPASSSQDLAWPQGRRARCLDHLHRLSLASGPEACLLNLTERACCQDRVPTHRGHPRASWPPSSDHLRHPCRMWTSYSRAASLAIASLRCLICRQRCALGWVLRLQLVAVRIRHRIHHPSRRRLSLQLHLVPWPVLEPARASFLASSNHSHPPKDHPSPLLQNSLIGCYGNILDVGLKKFEIIKMQDSS